MACRWRARGGHPSWQVISRRDQSDKGVVMFPVLAVICGPNRSEIDTARGKIEKGSDQT